MRTQLKVHMKASNQWFLLKSKKKKEVYIATTVTQLSQLLEDINSEGILAMFAFNVCFYITLSCSLGYAAAFEVSWDHTIPPAGAPRRFCRKRADSFSSHNTEIYMIT